jgi:hypothetical protein
LLPVDSTIRRVVENRCIFSNSALPISEYVVSRVRVPTLYSGPIAANDKQKVKEIVQFFVRNSLKFHQVLIESTQVRLSVRSFFGLCLSHKEDGDESILHAYIFLFWDDVINQVSLGRELHLAPQWASKAFGGSGGILTGDNELIADKLTALGVELDLFTWSPKHETLSMIEIKRGECDDRAIGQLLRYYQVAWKLLSTREFRQLNVNYIWPILVVSRVREKQLEAFPLHFQGLLDILVYSTSANGIPEFSSFRKAALTGRWT